MVDSIGLSCEPGMRELMEESQKQTALLRDLLASIDGKHERREGQAMGSEGSEKWRMSEIQISKGGADADYKPNPRRGQVEAAKKGLTIP